MTFVCRISSETKMITELFEIICRIRLSHVMYDLIQDNGIILFRCVSKCMAVHSVRMNYKFLRFFSLSVLSQLHHRLISMDKLFHTMMLHLLHCIILRMNFVCVSKQITPLVFCSMQKEHKIMIIWQLSSEIEVFLLILI